MASVKSVFDEVADLGTTCRAEYYGANEVEEAVRQEVEGLLQYDRSGTISVQRKLGRVSEDAFARLEHSGRRCGPYQLGELLGRGGMGAVYSAERVDGEVTRKVAVKLLPAGADGPAVRQRFLAERQILASLNHPGIASLIDAGHTEDGQPYLVMEHIDGVAIDVHARTLDVRKTLGLFLRVCEAVSYAHQNLVVHRDIKPSNILVDSRGEPRLLDFGIAKLLLDEDNPGAAMLLTGEGEGVLTPAYAAPEQVAGGKVTTATDVYALGVLLYVLLTGQHPAGPGPHSYADLLKAVIETEPRRPSDVTGLRGPFRADLDTIVAKAMRKTPGDRYVSAAALADDVRRYLNNEPIQARPATLTYRAAKLMKRHAVSCALGAAAVIATLAGVAGTLDQARTARVQRDFALQQLARAEAINDLNSFVLSDAAPSGKSFTVNDLLARAEVIVDRQRSTDPNTRLDLLISIGRQYTVQDEYGKARTILERAYQLSHAQNDGRARGRAACALAQTLSRTGETDRAERLFQDGMKALPANAQYALDRIFCLARGAEIASNGGNVRAAVERAQQARDLVPSLPVRSELAEINALITLAGAYSGAGRLPEALGAFEKAAATLNELGRADTQRAGTVFNNWGGALIRAGRPVEAARALKRSIEISMEGGSEDSVQAMPLVNYARALTDAGRLQEAADYVLRGIAKAEQSGDTLPVREGLLTLANIRCGQRDLDGCEGALGRVTALMQRTLPPTHGLFAAVAMHRAKALQARGDLRGAFAAASEAVDRIGAAPGSRGVLRLPPVLLTRAEIALAMGNIAQARSDAQRALGVLDEAGLTAMGSRLAGLAYMAMGRTLATEGKHTEAAAAFGSAARHLTMTLGEDHGDTRTARALAGDLSGEGSRNVAREDNLERRASL